MTDTTEEPTRHLVEIGPDTKAEIEALLPHVRAMAAVEFGEPQTDGGDVVALAVHLFFQQVTAQAYAMMQHAETSREAADDAITKAMKCTPKQ